MKFELVYPENFGKKYSTNKYYEGKNIHARNRDKDDWHGWVWEALYRMKVPKIPVDYPVELVFSFDDRLDCSNHSIVAKMIEDALKGWVIQDDTRKWVKRVVYEFNHQKKIIVEVRRYEPGLEIAL